MSRFLSVTALAALVCLVLGVLPGAPARATDRAEPGYSLDLAGPTTATVGRPLLLTATGHESHEWLAMYVDAFAIPASLVGSCPGSHDGALQLALSSSAQGGEKFAYVVPAEGSFSLPIAYTASRPGRFLLCAYLNDLSWDAAMAQHVVTVGEALRPPRNVVKPRLVRKSANLVCKRGTWADTPRSYAYRWFVNGKRKAATSSTLRITRALRGKQVRCVVTARNAAGAGSASSNTLRVR